MSYLAEYDIDMRNVTEVSYQRPGRPDYDGAVSVKRSDGEDIVIRCADPDGPEVLAAVRAEVEAGKAPALAQRADATDDEADE